MTARRCAKILDPLRRPGPMIPSLLRYLNTRARVTDLIARRTIHARARAPPRRRCAFYTRRATITWPMSVSRTARRIRGRVPNVRRREEEEDDDQGVEEERKAHTRAWFQ
jgi:hypothetical protein